MSDEYQWWGPALFALARAREQARHEERMSRKAYNSRMDAAVTQVRYMRALMGKWPTELFMPSRPPQHTLRVMERPRERGRFPMDDPRLVERNKVVDVQLGELRDSDGFWAAKFEGTRNLVMFWPSPREPPQWYGDYANE